MVITQSSSDWFKHLAADVLCFASPVRHFGLCWADQDADDANQIILGTSRAGFYNVMITAKRNDTCATTMCPQEVEYIPKEPVNPSSPFPPVSKMHKQKQTLGGSIYSGLQKGLQVGQKAVEYTALAKGIYETGQTLFSIGRAVAPVAAALL